MDNEDRKKIELMKKLLDENKNGRIYLNILLSKLEDLYRLIPFSGNPWKEVFFKNWVNIESVYAGALSEKREIFTSEEADMVQSWLNSIDELLAQLLSSYMKQPDSKVHKTAQEMEMGWLMCPDCIDAWESFSTDAMVICPKCDSALHNPRYQKSPI